MKFTSKLLLANHAQAFDLGLTRELRDLVTRLKKYFPDAEIQTRKLDKRSERWSIVFDPKTKGSFSTDPVLLLTTMVTYDYARILVKKDTPEDLKDLIELCLMQMKWSPDPSDRLKPEYEGKYDVWARKDDVYRRR